MTLKKSNLVLGIATATLTLAGAMVSPQASADYWKCIKSKTNTCKHHKHKATVITKTVTVAAPAAPTYDDSALRAQLAEQAAEINKLKAQPAPVMPEPVVKSESKDNMVFFRGGFGHSNKDRNGVSIYSTVAGSQLGLPGGKADKDAWYFGAGFDFSVSDDLFGLAKGTEVLAELMFDYKEFGVTQGNALAQTPTGLAAGTIAGNPPRSVTVNQFTLAASPKIKFLKGSDFRPWIQPVGFALQVISPPTESITVLQPAMMFGIGADYKVWKNIYVGADARYHLGLGGTMDGVNTNGFTAGGYLGLGF